MLKSENIVRVMDVMESSNNYYIVQELCDSDLEKHLKIKRKLPEEEAIQFLKQICNGFITLTKEGIVHRLSFFDSEISSQPIYLSARELSKLVISALLRKTSQNG